MLAISLNKLEKISRKQRAVKEEKKTHTETVCINYGVEFLSE